MIQVFTVPMHPGVKFVRWRDVGHPDIPRPLVRYQDHGRARTKVLIALDDAIDWFEHLLRLPDEDVPRSVKQDAREQLAKLAEGAQ